MTISPFRIARTYLFEHVRQVATVEIGENETALILSREDGVVEVPIGPGTYHVSGELVTTNPTNLPIIIMVIMSADAPAWLDLSEDEVSRIVGRFQAYVEQERRGQTHTIH